MTWSKIDRVIDRNISKPINELLGDIAYTFRISTANWSIGESYDAHLHNTDEKGLYDESGTQILDFTLMCDNTLGGVRNVSYGFFTES